MKKKAYWIISSDGYFPYCSNCCCEPKLNNEKKLPNVCPECKAIMTNTDIFNNLKRDKYEKD
jgi:hypothetical protein